MSKKSLAVLVNVACLGGAVLIAVLRPDTNFWVFLTSALAAFLIVNVALFRWAPRARSKEMGKNSSVILVVLSVLFLAAALLIEWQLRSRK